MIRLGFYSIVLIAAFALLLMDVKPVDAKVKMVGVCHVRYQTPNKGVVKNVPRVALDIHKAHGDCLVSGEMGRTCRCGAVGFTWGKKVKRGG